MLLYPKPMSLPILAHSAPINEEFPVHDINLQARIIKFNTLFEVLNTVERYTKTVGREGDDERDDLRGLSVWLWIFVGVWIATVAV